MRTTCPGFKQQSALGQARGLGGVMSNQYAGQSMVVHDVLNGRLDLQLGCFIQRGRRLIEQQHQRRVGQRASNGDALGFASRKIRNIAAGIALQSDAGQQLLDRFVRQRLSALQRTESQVLLHRARKKVGTLVHQTQLPAQLAGRDLPVVVSFDVDCAAGRFIEAIQQSEQ